MGPPPVSLMRDGRFEEDHSIYFMSMTTQQQGDRKNIIIFLKI